MAKEKLMFGKYSPKAIALAALTLVIGLVLGMFLKYTIEDKKYSCACFDEDAPQTTPVVEKAGKMSVAKNIKYDLNDTELSIDLVFEYDGERYITLDIIGNKAFISNEIIYDNNEVFTSEDKVMTVINGFYSKIKNNLNTMKDYSLDKKYLLLYYEDVNNEYILTINDKGNLLNKDISNVINNNVKILAREKLDNRTVTNNSDNTYKYILFDRYNLIELHDTYYYYLDLEEICNKEVNEYMVVIDNGVVTKSLTSIYTNKDGKFLIKSDKEFNC